MSLNNRFVGYEYKEKIINSDFESLLIDGYENFGWITSSVKSSSQGSNHVKIQFKRDRVIRNKAELTRLQRQFDAKVEEIQKLENSKTTIAFSAAISLGLLGLICSVFTVLLFNNQHTFLMIIFGLLSGIGCGLPFFLYQFLEAKKSEKVQPIIECKYDELYEIAKQGNKLLRN